MKYKINELSTLMDVSSNTIRRYEKLGYLNPVRNESSNYRYYTNADVSKIMFVRFFRKMGFAHPDILQILSQDIQSSIPLCNHYLAAMDQELANLTKSRHLLKDYIKLMTTQPEYMAGVHTMNAVPLYYTLFCSNSRIYNEPERLRLIQQYMYHARETHMIYLFKKEDILNNHPICQSGWAIKPKDIPELQLEDSPYIESYPAREILVSEVAIPIDIEYYLAHEMTDCRTTKLEDVVYYLYENQLDLAGDVVAIRISLASQEDKDVHYLLIDAPYAQK